jgi:hypothetical protein
MLGLDAHAYLTLVVGTIVVHEVAWLLCNVPYLVLEKVQRGSCWASTCVCRLFTRRRCVRALTRCAGASSLRSTRK